MLAAALPAPAILVMFQTSDYHLYVMLSPLVFLLANLWAGSIVALFQDLVLPRMFGTVGAVYLLGSNMIGLALGPYVSGKVATLTGSLRAGVFSLLVAPAVGLVTFWFLSRQVEQAERTKVAQAVEAGEAAALAEAGGVAWPRIGDLDLQAARFEGATATSARPPRSSRRDRSGT
jgi:hypothetical protein